MIAQIVAAEVEGLHRFIETWFHGAISNTSESFARLSTAWPEGFSLIDPCNERHSSRELLESTYGLHGKFPRLSIQVRNMQVSCQVPGTAVAVYEEWHVEPHETEARLCSATFAFDPGHPNRARWVHVHESKLAV